MLSLSKNRDNLDCVFQELFHDFNCYKMDVNDDEEFHGKDENAIEKYEHNDAWMEKIDKSDDKLEILAKQKSDLSEHEAKPDLLKRSMWMRN